MVQELLQEFYRNTKKRPERIIVYRDGVSEGQFDAVVREELPQVCSCTLLLSLSQKKLV
jgi:eukaryotic translation initiation factor 2C